jgi:tRNA dimethylallyltransferase
MARKKASELIKRKKVPFVVGGTGLYIKSMIYGLFESKPSSPEIRAKLKREAKVNGPAALHRRLEKIDPENGVAPASQRRLSRGKSVGGF